MNDILCDFLLAATDAMLWCLSLDTVLWVLYLSQWVLSTLRTSVFRKQ